MELQEEQSPNKRSKTQNSINEIMLDSQMNDIFNGESYKEQSPNSISNDSDIREPLLPVNQLINNKKVNKLPSWEEISNPLEKGRIIMEKIWNDLKLIRTAKYIGNKDASNITILELLYNRLKYMEENPDFLEKKGNIYLDLKKAYDSVEHWALENTLKTMGFK